MLMRPASGRDQQRRRRSRSRITSSAPGSRRATVSSAERASMSCAPASRCWMRCSASQRFPRPDVKTQASEFRTVSGGNARQCRGRDRAARRACELRRSARRAAGTDTVGDTMLALAARESIECVGLSARRRRAPRRFRRSGSTARGERAIVNYRDERLTAARPDDRGGAGRGRRRGARRQPLSGLRARCVRRGAASAAFRSCSMPTSRAHDSNRCSTLVVACDVLGRRPARDRRHRPSRARADRHRASRRKAFVAVTDGANDVLWLDDGELRQVPAFEVDAVDTLGAGDTFHGAFALMLAEGSPNATAMRFAAAAAALKCTRFGGSSSAPTRAEVEAFLATARLAQTLFLLRRRARRAARRAGAGEILRRDGPRGSTGW